MYMYMYICIYTVQLVQYMYIYVHVVLYYGLLHKYMYSEYAYRIHACTCMYVYQEPLKAEGPKQHPKALYKINVHIHVHVHIW